MREILFVIMLLLLSCKENPIDSISNEYISDLNYSLNLSLDDSEPKSITQVHIKWNQWEENDSITFSNYHIQDVTTFLNNPEENSPKDLDFITNSSDTIYSIDFAAGTFLKICVVANFTDESYISSDTIQFFTQPMSAVSNILIDSQPAEHHISWDASSENNISSLIIYRSYIEEGDDNPNLLINPSNGMPEQDEWQWDIIYEGDNSNTDFIDTTNIFSDYKYFYSIKVQVEDSDNIENYRYSIISPAVSEMINPISNHLFNLNVSDDFKDVIMLEWETYTHDDFYSYEIWRSDIATTSTQTIESDGEKLVEIINKNLDYFEDRLSIGSGKKWYYFIRTYNNYGEEIISEVVQGDTRL